MAVVRNQPRRNKIGDRRREEMTKTTTKRLTNNDYSITKEGKTFDIERYIFKEQAKFIDGEEYDAIITNAYGLENDEGAQTLIVEAEAINETGGKRKFNRYIDAEMEEGSFLHRFCKNMNAISSEGRIVLQSLIGKEVVITLYTNSKGKTYISTIFPTDSSDDTEEDDYFYDNDFTYNDGEDGGCIYES